MPEETKQNIKDPAIKNNANKLFNNLDELIFLYQKRGQKISIMGNQLRKLEARVARLEM